jgi:hypothetical protein
LISALDPFTSQILAVGTLGPLQCQTAPDLDNVVREHPKANPSLHTFKASVPASIQSMTTLQYADATFASSPPALPGSEPTRSLQFSPLAAFAVAIRHCDANHSHGLDDLLIP